MSLELTDLVPKIILVTDLDTLSLLSVLRQHRKKAQDNKSVPKTEAGTGGDEKVCRIAVMRMPNLKRFEDENPAKMKDSFHPRQRLNRMGLVYIVVLLVLCLLAQPCTAWDMEAVDVSDSTHYKELSEHHILVVDLLHTQQISRRDGASIASNGTANITLNTPSGLPQPFDTSIGSNFTSTNCPDFFTKFLNNATFQSCLPVSMLLQNSMSFFKAAQSPSLLDKTLDAACSASLAVCSPLMNYFATQLISASSCQADYAQQNPLVLQAYAALRAYEPVYQATCLKDKISNGYCFAQAMTKSSNVDDSYPYYTAVGLQLPAGSRADCDTCLQQTMQIFSGYAVQKEQPLSQTYLNCAVQVNSVCGQAFANIHVQNLTKNASKNMATSSSTTPFMYSFLLSVVLSSLFLQ